jgi:hypothetical protein
MEQLFWRSLCHGVAVTVTVTLIVIVTVTVTVTDVSAGTWSGRALDTLSRASWQARLMGYPTVLWGCSTTIQ